MIFAVGLLIGVFVGRTSYERDLREARRRKQRELKLQERVQAGKQGSRTLVEGPEVEDHEEDKS